LATLALQLPDSAPLADAAPAVLPDFPIRALDWPCWEAPSMREAWDRLALCAVEPNPFFESWHLLPALRALDPGETVQLLMFETDGQLAGMIPVTRQKRLSGKRGPHLALWTHPDYHHGAPLVAAGREREFWQALLAWADGWGRFGKFLRLPHLPLEGPLHRALDSVLKEAGRSSRPGEREERPMLAAGSTPETYFAAVLSDAEREEMGRLLTGLCDLGEVAFDRTQSAEGLSEWIDRFLELDGEAHDGEYLSPAGKRLRQTFEGAAEQGKLERLSLSLDGTPIAMLANFIVPPGAFACRTVSDEAHARFSPGLLLHCENLLVLDRPEIAWAVSCAKHAHPAIGRLWRERRASGALTTAIGGKLRRSLFRGRIR
jgi:Acetyltransferase (GNAT) domain